MVKRSLVKLAAIGALMVAFGAVAFGTSTRSADAAPASVVVNAFGACGGSITATATVREPNGAPSVGVPVTFVASTGGTGFGVTNFGGVAQAVIPAAMVVNTTVTATAGGVSGQTIVGVNCAPVHPVCPVYGCVPNCTHNYVGYPYYNQCAPVVRPIVPVHPVVVQPVVVNPVVVNPVVVNVPAKINVSVNPGVINCGNASSIAINVTNGWGAPLNTSVSLSTSMGTITPSVFTSAGNAVATLNTAAGTGGVALIRASAAGASTTASVTVTCAAPVQQQIVYQPAPAQVQQQVVVTRPAPAQQPQRQVVVEAPRQQQQVVVTRPAPAQPQRAPQMAAPQQPARQPARAPQFAAPRTGEAGLLNMLIENDEAANAALIDAFERWNAGEVDASVVDSSIAIEGEEPVMDASAADAQLEVFDVDARLVDDNIIGDADASASLALELDGTHRAGDFGIS